MSAVENNELKGGHAPANKVGGRRVVNRKERNHSDSIEHTNSECSDDGAVIREIIDSDLPAKMEKSYPTQSVRKTHEKPLPTHQPQSLGAVRATVGRVVQPRKQTH